MANMFDALKMMGKMGEIKETVASVKNELKFLKITHESDDGLIKIYLDGNKELKKIDINPNMIHAAAKDDLEKRLVEELNLALNKASDEGKKLTKEAIKEHLPDIPGLDPDNLPF